MAHEPVVGVPLQVHQLAVAQFRKIEIFHRLGLAVSDFVNAPARTIRAVRVVALAKIIPVTHEHAAVRPVADGDGAEPRIVREEKIPAVLRDVAGAAAREFVVEQAVAVEVAHHDPVAVGGGPVVSEVDHRPRVRVTAPEFILAAAGLAPMLRIPMQMIGGLIEKLIDVRIKILAEHPLVMRARHDVPEMSDDVIREERLAVVIPIEAPRIRRAGGHDFKNLFHRMIAPDGATELHALVLRCAGPANERVCGDAVASVEPAVRPPREAVHHVVAGLERPAVEDDFRCAVRHAIAVAVGIEQKIRRARDPHAAEAHGHAADALTVLQKNFALIKTSVAVFVREDQNAVAVFHFEIGIGKTLGHPEPPAIIEVEGDGLHHVRFAGEEGGAETFRQRELLQGGVGRNGRVARLLRVHHTGRQRGADERDGANQRAGQEDKGCSHELFVEEKLAGVQSSGFAPDDGKPTARARRSIRNSPRTGHRSRRFPRAGPASPA